MPRLIQLRNIRAKDIMSERLIICQRTERLSEVLGRMKKMDIHELPVVEGGKLLGMVSYDMFIKRKSLPLTTTVENLMVTPPKVDVNDSITRVAEVMLVNHEVPLIPIFHYSNICMFDPDRITGITAHPRQQR